MADGNLGSDGERFWEKRNREFGHDVERAGAYFLAVSASTAIAATQVWLYDMPRTSFLQLSMFSLVYGSLLFVFGAIAAVVDRGRKDDDYALAIGFTILIIVIGVLNLAYVAWPLFRCGFDVAACGIPK